jgi:Rrf2 family cysteine metabolism transcriptional repressor
VVDSPVPGETGFAFHGAGKPGNDGGWWIPRRSLSRTRSGTGMTEKGIIQRSQYAERDSMRLTTRSEYSLLALIHIARNEKHGFVKMEDICGQYGLSKKYLEQIVSSLKQARYIKTKTGAGGGYKLAKPAEKISLAEIIRLMDGALAPTSAVSKYFFEHTPLEKEKKLMRVFKEIRDYISAKVERLKISDLV